MWSDGVRFMKLRMLWTHDLLRMTNKWTPIQTVSSCIQKIFPILSGVKFPIWMFSLLVTVEQVPFLPFHQQKVKTTFDKRQWLVEKIIAPSRRLGPICYVNIGRQLLFSVALFRSLTEWTNAMQQWTLLFPYLHRRILERSLGFLLVAFCCRIFDIMSGNYLIYCVQMK